MIQSAVGLVSNPNSSPSTLGRDDLRRAVARSLGAKPICAVVRTGSAAEARRQAQAFIAGGLELIEITFSVPDAPSLVAELLTERGGSRAPWIGMGTVTTGNRARRAVEVGSEFIVSPNTSGEVARVAKEAGLYLMLGALSATEIVAAWELGSDIVKVYPLPPVGGPRYLATVRQPLADIPMLAGGGFSVDEIPAYLEAGASAFGVGSPLLADDPESTRELIARALRYARGGEAAES